MSDKRKTASAPPSQSGQSSVPSGIPGKGNDALNNRDDLMEAQRDLAVRLGTTTGMADGLRVCLEVALKVSEMEAGGIYVADKGGTLEMVSHQGLSEAFVDYARRFAAESANARLVQAGKPVYVPYEQLGFPESDIRLQEKLLTIAVIPIHFENRVVGCLNVASRRQRDVPASARVSLETIAAQIGSALARMKAEEALRESESKFRSMMEAMDDLVYICSKDYRVEYMNPAMVRRTGRDATGEVCYKALHDLDSICAWCVHDVVMKGECRKWEVTSPKDGRTFSVSNTPLRHGDGTISKMAVIRDITELKKASEDRRKLETQMLHAQKLESLGVLAGGIAHDFNNLLVAILGNLDLALADLSPSSPVRDTLKAAEMASQRAADLCRQLLAYSGKGRFVVEALDLNAALEEMAHMLEVSISKKVAIRLDLAPDLPAIEADATQLRQVVMNLVVNASDAIGHRNGSIAISTGCRSCDRAFMASTILSDDRAEGAYVYFTVTDTGCGMDKETAGRIFDPFFSTKFAGRGLGLAAVLGIVRNHKGLLEVASEPGKGTTFRIYFPALSRSMEPAAGKAAGGDLWKGHGIVLLVDDEQIVLDVAKIMVTRMGLEVLLAEDGQKAVALFKEHANEIVCVLLDLSMPGMDGVETFRELRRVRRDVPIVLASGYTEDSVERLKGEGLAGFIQKPYQLATMSRTLREILTKA